MVMTDAMIEAQSKNREYHQRIVKLMICRANYSSGVPNGIEFAECQDESLKPCDTCPVRQEWNKVLEGYMEQGLEKSEASWLTHQFFDIPTARMGEDKSPETDDGRTATGTRGQIRPSTPTPQGVGRVKFA